MIIHSCADGAAVETVRTNSIPSGAEPCLFPKKSYNPSTNLGANGNLGTRTEILIPI
jgi:hypothetical protein